MSGQKSMMVKHLHVQVPAREHAPYATGLQAGIGQVWVSADVAPAGFAGPAMVWGQTVERAFGMRFALQLGRENTW